MGLELLRELRPRYCFFDVHYCLVGRDIIGVSHVDDVEFTFGLRHLRVASGLVIKALGHTFLSVYLLICKHMSLAWPHLR